MSFLDDLGDSAESFVDSETAIVTEEVNNQVSQITDAVKAEILGKLKGVAAGSPEALAILNTYFPDGKIPSEFAAYAAGTGTNTTVRNTTVEELVEQDPMKPQNVDRSGNQGGITDTSKPKAKPEWQKKLEESYAKNKWAYWTVGIGVIAAGVFLYFTKDEKPKSKSNTEKKGKK